jgi:glutaredoxin
MKSSALKHTLQLAIMMVLATGSTGCSFIAGINGESISNLVFLRRYIDTTRSDAQLDTDAEFGAVDTGVEQADEEAIQQKAVEAPTCPAKLTVFGHGACLHCNALRKSLENMKVAYEYVDINANTTGYAKFEYARRNANRDGVEVSGIPFAVVARQDGQTRYVVGNRPAKVKGMSCL